MAHKHLPHTHLKYSTVFVAAVLLPFALHAQRVATARKK
jgi:hypothetical protein